MEIPKEVIFQKFFECVVRNAEKTYQLLDTIEKLDDRQEFYLFIIQEMPLALDDAGYKTPSIGDDVYEYIIKLADTYALFCLRISPNFEKQ